MSAKLDIKEIAALAPRLLRIPFKQMWYDYDETADVLYINFKEKANSDDAKITADDIIIHYEKGKIVGLTLLHAGKRAKRRAEGARSPLKSAQIRAAKSPIRAHSRPHQSSSKTGQKRASA